MTRSSAVTSVSRRATNRTTNTTAKTRAAAAIAAAGVGRGERPAVATATSATTGSVLPAPPGAILNATSPFFTVIVAGIWARARPSAAQVAGTVIGFAGVAVLTGVGSLELGPGVLGGIALALVGAFSYAVAAVYTGRTFLRLPPISLAVNQLIASGTILLLP